MRSARLPRVFPSDSCFLKFRIRSSTSETTERNVTRAPHARLRKETSRTCRWSNIGFLVGGRENDRTVLKGNGHDGVLAQDVECRGVIHERNESEVSKRRRQSPVDDTNHRCVIRVLFGDDFHVVHRTERLKAMLDFCASRLTSGEMDARRGYGRVAYLTRKVFHE